MSPLLMKTELYRLSRKPLMCVIAIASLFALKGIVFMAARLGAFGGIENGFAFVGVSAGYTLFLASFLLCMSSAATLSGEYSSGLLRMNLSRPVSRSSYFLNRAFYVVFLALLLILLDACMGTLVGGLGYGFDDVADVGLQGPQFSRYAMAWLTVRAYAMTFLGMAGLAALGLFISTVFRSPTLSLGAAAGFFFLMEGVRLLFREPVAGYVVTCYTGLHMDRVAAMARGIAEYSAPDFAVKSIGVPVAYYLVAGGFGLFLFMRRDVLG
ncbi:MAG: ABC transporter permease [Planctomycetota bacterium]